MPGMGRKEISRLLEHVEPQGVGVTRTKKGVMLRLPDKSQTMIHWTGSDVRERDNVKARLKRSGVTWPGDDAGPLGVAITGTRPRQATLDRGAALLSTWDQKYINGSQLRRLSQADGSDMNNATAQRILFHLGWTPCGKSTSRKWLRPIELQPDIFEDAPVETTEALQPPVELHPAVELEREPAQLVALEAPVPAPEPEVKVSQLREFIDTADSWVIDSAALTQYTTWADIQRMLKVMGLQGELRVWRTPNA